MGETDAVDVLSDTFCSPRLGQTGFEPAQLMYQIIIKLAIFCTDPLSSPNINPCFEQITAIWMA